MRVPRTTRGKGGGDNQGAGTIQKLDCTSPHIGLVVPSHYFAGFDFERSRITRVVVGCTVSAKGGEVRKRQTSEPLVNIASSGQGVGSDQLAVPAGGRLGNSPPCGEIHIVKAEPFCEA